MSWEKSIEELRRRERLAEKMGGEEPVERQRGRGKLTVRERVAFLADPGSFHEIGKIAGKATYSADDELEAFLPSNSVTGRATINGESVAILADDFTVRGGASDASIRGKLIMMIKMAAEYRMPLVQMIDGTGGGGSVKSLEQDPRTYIPETPGWDEIVHGMSQVPFVSLALGPCAGMGAGRVAASHFSVMVKELSQVFVAGPPVAIALGENVTKEELGGWKIQAQNGTVDNVVDSEADAFITARRFLSYLPPSVHDLPERTSPADHPDRKEESLLSIDKVTRHMDLCSMFHLPVIHFVDCPGFAVGVKAETAGVTRAGVRAMTAVYQADVPVCSVVIRKAYGLAGSVMMNQSRTKWRYCWPSGDWGSLPMAGGIEAAFRKELAEAEDPDALKEQLYRKFEAIRSPFRTAESFLAEEIIDPRDTRPLLVDFIHHGPDRSQGQYQGRSPHSPLRLRSELLLPPRGTCRSRDRGQRRCGSSSAGHSSVRQPRGHRGPSSSKRSLSPACRHPCR